jgi:hypothetical protein
VAKVEKPKDAEAELPETDFNMYNYKTFLVNNPDMRGEGLAKTKEMFKSEEFSDGFTYWHFKYDKFGDEGQVQWKFANLLEGFMQRCEPKLSPIAFGRVVMLGQEPNLDLEAVWLLRGTTIPAKFLEHPQIEHWVPKKLDFMNNDQDYYMV